MLTAALFALMAWRFGMDRMGFVFTYSILGALLLVATFVDIEHMIIPDEVTLGGVVAGIVCSAVWPELHSVPAFWQGAVSAFAGAAVGYAMLWVVVEGGRLMFGRRNLFFDVPVAAEWSRNGDHARLVVDGEEMLWEEFFPRGTETLRMKVVRGEIDAQSVPVEANEWTWKFEQLEVQGRKFDLNTVSRVILQISHIGVPREVMGFGDVKLLAAIGAFLGWKAALFTVFAASCCGAILGTTFLLSGRKEWASKIPFGPYLAAGAMLWVFAGTPIIQAYWGLFSRWQP